MSFCQSQIRVTFQPTANQLVPLAVESPCVIRFKLCESDDVTMMHVRGYRQRESRDACALCSKICIVIPQSWNAFSDSRISLFFILETNFRNYYSQMFEAVGIKKAVLVVHVYTGIS